MKDSHKMLIVGLLIVGGMTLDYRWDQEQQKFLERAEHCCSSSTVPALTREQKTYRALFQKHGSPAPDAMARAVTVAKPKNRPLLAAVAIIESNANPRAVGDDGKSIGAWQIQPHHWGKVSTDDPAQQALLAERIIEELVASEPRGSLRRNARRIRAGLAAYNGGTRPHRCSWRYADRVLALSKKLRLEV